MIRFSAALVVIALGLLVAGGVTSKLPLVYLAIAVSAVALGFLVVGAILNRGELRATVDEAPPARPSVSNVDQGPQPEVPARIPVLTGPAARTGGTTDTGDIKHTENTENTGHADENGGIKDAGDTRPAGQVVTVVPGVPRYHRSECILIRFMGASDLQTMPVEAAREAGSTPCRACHPDGEETD